MAGAAVIMGRIGVDLYPQQEGPLEYVTSFAKSVGGTAANVAVAAARLGISVDLITAVGDDQFGEYLVRALRGFGVGTDLISTDQVLRTPLAFAELDPPESPGLLFYRSPSAPDLQLVTRAGDARTTGFAEADLAWVTGTGLSVEPSRATTMGLLETRGRASTTVFDLDWRPMLWPDAAEAPQRYRAALRHCSIAVGNREEVSIATGLPATSDPDVLAQALLDLGPDVAVVKLGGEGTYAQWKRSWSPGDERDGSLTVPVTPVEVVCGLGAGDAFGGSLVEGIVRGRTIAETLARASKAGAIVAGRLACADAMPTPDELDG